jgi:hypothetical protein
VCAPSEAAADVIGRRIAEALGPGGPLHRVPGLLPCPDPRRVLLRVCSPSRLDLAFQSFPLMRFSVVDESGRWVSLVMTLLFADHPGVFVV